MKNDYDRFVDLLDMIGQGFKEETTFSENEPVIVIETNIEEGEEIYIYFDKIYNFKEFRVAY